MAGLSETQRDGTGGSQYYKRGLRQQVCVTEDPWVEDDNFLFKLASTVRTEVKTTEDFQPTVISKFF